MKGQLLLSTFKRYKNAKVIKIGIN